MLRIEPPNTFLIAISFVRCWVVNEAIPKMPVPVRRMEIAQKIHTRDCSLFSALYRFSNLSDRNSGSRGGAEGSTSLYLASICLIALSAWLARNRMEAYLLEGLSQIVNGITDACRDSYLKLSTTPTTSAVSPPHDTYRPTRGWFSKSIWAAARFRSTSRRRQPNRGTPSRPPRTPRRRGSDPRRWSRALRVQITACQQGERAYRRRCPPSPYRPWCPRQAASAQDTSLSPPRWCRPSAAPRPVASRERRGCG